MSSVKNMSLQNCIAWARDKRRNPVTRRAISVNGPTYKAIEAACEQHLQNMKSIDEHVFYPTMSAVEFEELYKHLHSILDAEARDLITTGTSNDDRIKEVKDMAHHIEKYKEGFPISATVQAHLQGGERSKLFLLRKKANQILFIRSTLGDMQPVIEKKSYSATKEVPSSQLSKSSSIHESLPELPKKTRAELLKDLEAVCSELYDPIAMDDFSKFRKKKLHLVVAVGPDGGRKHCYYVKSLHNAWVEAVESNKSVKDPMNPRHRLTEEELREVAFKMRYIDHDYKPPRKSMAIDPRLQMKIEEEAHTPNFYHITASFQLGQVRLFWDLGYIPADIDVQDTGSSDLTSTVMVAKIHDLFQKGRIFKRNFIPIDGNCCRVHLWKKPAFWGTGQERIQKFLALMEELNRA